MKKFLFLPLFFLLFGCSLKSPQSSKGYHVTLVSPMIKISDFGFMHEYKNDISLQIYNLALIVAEIKISNNICINRGCFSKSDFNAKFFKQPYYDEILSDILLKKPLFNGVNLEKTECGFSQNYKEISYEVCKNDLKFKDKNVKIILKEQK
ncbi:hypothetical protein [Campylobacter gastrosuis]